MANNIHIKLQQSINIDENNVPAELVTKLYNLLDKAINKGTITWDLEADSIKGSFKTGYTYDKYIKELKEFFGDNLNITPAGYYIYFDDPNVESVLMTYVNNTYPDEHFTGVIKELIFTNSGSNYTKFGFKQIFKNNTDIVNFNEMSELTNCKRFSDDEFAGCTQLKRVDLTNIEYFSNRTFQDCYNLEFFNGKNSNSGDLSLDNCASDGLARAQELFMWRTINGTRVGPKIKRILSLGNCNQFNNNREFAYNDMLEYIEPTVLENLVKANDTFAYCSNLVIDDLKLPNITRLNGTFNSTKVKKISELGFGYTLDAYSFLRCTSLTEITDDALANISVLGNEVFNGCTNLEIDDLKLPNLTSIGRDTFRSTKVKKISNLGYCSIVGGFRDCNLLTSVTLPTLCNNLGYEAFRDCTQLNNISITNIVSFNEACLQNVKCLPSILYLPLVTEGLGFKSFKYSNVMSIYLPNARHTRGIQGKNVPAPCWNFNRGDGSILACGNNMFIFYFKNIQDITGGAFGSRMYVDIIDVNENKPNGNMPNIEGYYTMIDGSKVQIFNNDSPERGGKPIPINATRRAGDPMMNVTGVDWANIKYLIINNITPPLLYYGYIGYGSPRHYFGGIGIWGKSSSSKSFEYLVVPRSAIETYKTWYALKPNIDTTYLNETELSVINENSIFDVNKIIALESMGHFETKLDYDNAPEKPDGIHSKDEYLIEEYMGLDINETINWDPTPTWSI